MMLNFKVIVNIPYLQMIINKNRAFRQLIGNSKLFGGRSRLLFSQLRSISERGLKCIIYSKWINVIIKSQKDLDTKIEKLKKVSKKEEKQEIEKQIRDQTRESIRDKLLKIGLKQIIQEVKSKDQPPCWKVQDNVEMQNAFNTIQGQYFDEGVDFQKMKISGVFDQSRFIDAIVSKQEKKYTQFYPTNFSTGPIFSLLERLTNRYLVLGTSGTGKSLSLVFLTMFSHSINRYIFESYGSSQMNAQRDFLLGSNLILQIPKIFYLDIDKSVRHNIQYLVRNQCQELEQIIPKEQDKSDDNYLTTLFVAIKQRYAKKNIAVLLIRDQINQTNSTQQKSVDYFEKSYQVVKLTNNLATYTMQSGSNNIQLQQVFNTSGNNPIHGHNQLNLFRTPFTPFGWINKRQIGNYLLFELEQRGYISKQAYQQLSQNFQKKEQILQFFEELSITPKDITPKVIRQTLLSKFLKTDFQSYQNIKQSIESFIETIKTIQQRQSELIIFLTNNSPVQNYLRTTVFGFYLSLAQNYQNSKKILEDKNTQLTTKQKNKLTQLSDNSLQSFVKPQFIEIMDPQIQNQMQNKRKIKIPFCQKEPNIISENTFNHNLFQIHQISKHKNDKMNFFVTPFINTKDFIQCFQTSYNKIAHQINRKFSTASYKNQINYREEIQKSILQNRNGHKYEDTLLKVLKKGNVKIRIRKDQFYYAELTSKNTKFIELNTQNNKFTDHFQKIIFQTKQQQSHHFMLPSDSKGFFFQSDPSIDFIILDILQKENKIIYTFNTFNANTVFPFPTLYKKKATDYLNFMGNFKDLKNFNLGSKQEFVQISQDKSFRINHYILGIEKTKEAIPKQLLRNIHGLNKINYLNILDFQINILNKQKQKRNVDLEQLNFINTRLQEKRPQMCFYN